MPVTARWKDIGLVLRLDLSQLDIIETNHRNCVDCLTHMLSLWLKKSYNTERFGDPSWQLLARAVGDPAGGNNRALAEEIHLNHGGSYAFVIILNTVYAMFFVHSSI